MKSSWPDSASSSACFTRTTARALAAVGGEDGDINVNDSFCFSSPSVQVEGPIVRPTSAKDRACEGLSDTCPGAGTTQR
jgi:hypothetical protein